MHVQKGQFPEELPLQHRRKNLLADCREEAAAKRHDQEPVGSIDSEQIGATAFENVLCNERRGYKAYPA